MFMKDKFLIGLLILIIFGILLYSFDFNDDEESSIKDIYITEDILGDKLDVKYIGGNMIDEKLMYGNSFIKEIEVSNTSNKDIVYALSLKEKNVSNELLSVSVYAELENEEVELLKDKTLKEENIIYNLVISKNDLVKLKVVFLSNKEGGNTFLKGRLQVTTNLSEKEIFIHNINNIQKALENKIDELNGIVNPGYYMIDVSLLDSNFNGNILINANDISSLEYYYSVNNNNYMINDYLYKGKLSQKNVVIKADMLDRDGLCITHSKRGCSDFNDIPYNQGGGKKSFLKNVKTILDSLKDSVSKLDKNVYIYDVKSDIQNDTNVRGYVLVDNTKDSSELYLYLTDESFMISGYNYSKYGEITETSGTIRAYKESAFNLSSSDKARVCSFSGFSECFNLNNEKVL